MPCLERCGSTRSCVEIFAGDNRAALPRDLAEGREVTERGTVLGGIAFGPEGSRLGTGQLGHGLGPRSFRGPALSKVNEMCRHSYSLSHEKSEKMFWIVTWPISHVSGINGDFRRKSPIFPTPVYT